MQQNIKNIKNNSLMPQTFRGNAKHCLSLTGSNSKYIQYLPAVLFFLLFLFFPPSAHAGLILNHPNYFELDNGLVGYWSFDGKDMAGVTAYDRSGQGNNGTLTNGPTKIAGKLGQALSFKSSNSAFVNMPDSTAIRSLTLKTFSAWINPTSLNGSYIVSKTNAASLGWSLRAWCASSFNNCLRFDQMTNGTQGGWDTLEGTLKVGIWQHIVVIMDTSSINNQPVFYLNGTQVPINIISSSPTGTFGGDSGQNLLIGADGNGNNTFDGKIDDVRVYNRALTQAEITRLYRIGATLHVNTQINNDTLANGLVGWWSFDGKDMAGVTAYDRSGQGNNGTLTNMSDSANGGRVIGKLGQALSFDGVDDYVDMGSGSATVENLTNNFSISTWIKLDSYPSGVTGIVSKKDGSDVGYCLCFNGSSFHYIGFPNFGFADAFADNVSSLGIWYHIIAVQSNGKNILYINGVQQSQTGSATIGSNTVDLVVGRIYAGFTGYYFPGSIDDVRVYNRVLTQAEITRLYRIGATLHVNTQINNDTLTNGLVGWWSFDGKDMAGVTAYDRSGQGNNGTLTNMSDSANGGRVAGKLGQALSFDGTDDYVGGSAISSLANNNVTISVWVYPLSSSPSFPSIAVQWASFGPTLFLSSNGTVANFQMDSVANGRVTTDANTITRDKWNHIVGIYAGNQLLLYINGSLSKTIATDATNPGISTPFLIGAPASGSGLDYFKGMLDDVRIYNRVLTQAEITRLYNLGR